MKVKDLFSLNKDYSKISYIAGESGAENELLDIDILEIPDGMYWVEKGDFIITMGYFPTTSNVTFENFIRMLIQNGASGLGVKLGRFFTAIPENAIKLAEENNFPIINFPLKTRYKEILQPVRNQLVSERLYKSEIILEYKKSLTELINNDLDIKNIMRHMKKYIDCEYYLINENATSVISSTSPLHSEDVIYTLKNNLQNISNKKDRIFRYKNYDYFTVGVSGICMGYLCVFHTNKNLSDTDILIIKETIPYIMIYIYSFKTKIYDTNNIDTFFQKLLDGEYTDNDQQMIRDAAQYNVSMNTYRLCAAVDVSQYNIETINIIFNKIKEILNSYRIVFFACIKNRNIYMIIKNDKRISSKFFDNIFNMIAESIRFSLCSETASVYVSEISNTLSNLPHLLNQVNFLINFTKETKPVFYYEDYVLDNILKEIQDNRSINNIMYMFLGKISQLEENEKEEIIRTVISLSENDFNLNKSAQALFLHRNSLYKRINKIEKMLNVNLENSDDKFMISLIARMIKND